VLWNKSQISYSGAPIASTDEEEGIQEGFFES
jgi:hypothetical protein